MQQDAGNSNALSVLAPRINHVLIDHENVVPTRLDLLDRSDIRVWIFVGALQSKTSVELAMAAKAMGERAQYVPVEKSGKNALDFVLAFHLGTLAEREPDAYFHIISKDTGYDPLITQMRSRKLHAHRAETVETMVIFPQKRLVPATSAAAEPLSPVTSTAALAPDPVKVPVVADEKKAAAPKASTPVATPPKASATPLPPPTKACTAKAMDDAQRLIVIRKSLVEVKNKNARPAKRATLNNHVRARFQNNISKEHADQLIAQLRKDGVIRFEGEKVFYR